MGPKASASSGSANKRSRPVPKDSEEYLKKRERNNVAVRKSREKSRGKASETIQRIDLLKEENVKLEAKVITLQKELSFLKDLFCNSAGEVIVNSSCKDEIKSEEDNAQNENPPVNEKALIADHEYFASTPKY